jgi:hypothetical protein
LLDTFEHPSSEARNLELLSEAEYREIEASVTNWESNPFDDVEIPQRDR